MVAAEVGNNEGQQAPQENPIMFLLSRGFLLLSMIRLYSQLNEPATTTTTTTTSPITGTISHRPICAWDVEGSYVDVNIYFTDTEEYDSTTTDILAEWHQPNVLLQDPEQPYYEANVTIPLTRGIQYNETNLYAHVNVIRRQFSVSKNDKKDPMDEMNVKFLLTKHKVRKGLRMEKSLLDSTTSSTVDTHDQQVQHPQQTTDNPLSLAGRNTTHPQTLLYLKPTLTLQWVPQTGLIYPDKSSIPPTIKKHMTWYNETTYFPILYRSEFWTTTDQLKLVNETVTNHSVAIRMETVSMFKWNLMSQMEASWEQNSQGEDEDAANDIFRTMLLETNPYLLIVTAIVSLLHFVFDILAFKNDISFFKNKKSMAGLSLRSMIVNAVFQLIILFYLADNDTSYMVLMSNGMGLAIEIWKISKAVKLSFHDGLSLVWVEDEEKSTTDLQKQTREYDEIAMTHLIYVTTPLVAGYGIYSLLHKKHKGWISWILSTLVGFIYLFGFINMTPQLFINYKLQSVAHLNWRTLTYKSINTFIDDLFAFVIKMPIMHRLACLRDDIIFFVYCYQRYIYKTDYTRVNEYGQCTQPTEEMLKEQQELQETTSQAKKDK